MAEEEKSEQASEKRLSDAFERGEVPLGRDAVIVAGLAAGSFALLGVARGVQEGLVQLFATALRGADQPSLFRLLPLATRPLGLALGACCAVPLAAILMTAAQTKGGFWPELPLPDFSRLVQTRKLTRLFSRELLADLGLAAIKVTVLAAVTFAAVRDDFLALGALFTAPAGALLGGLFAPVAHGASKVLGALALLAGMDLATTHIRFRSRMKMTKDETRREQKEEDGDPLIRNRRRRKHRELAKARAVFEVPRADALLVNPTHVAIALRYRRGEDQAPRVTAKGKGQLAEIMRDLARSNGIPIVQDIPLARLLHRKVKAGGLVPADTYRAVAAILAFVYRVTGRNAAGGPGSANSSVANPGAANPGAAGSSAGAAR